MKENIKQKIEILPNFQGMFFNENLKNYLYRKYKIVVKNVGIDKSTKTMKEFLIQPFLIDEFSLTFLAEQEPELVHLTLEDKKLQQKLNNVKKSLVFLSYKFLKQQYFLINGHKFGCSFLAYDKNPQKNHAKALIFCGIQSQMTSNFNHMTRLSQIAKKQCHFIYLDQISHQLKVRKLQRQTNGNTKKQHKVKKLAVKDEQKN